MASRSRWTGLQRLRRSAAWISVAFLRPPSTSIKPTGSRTARSSAWFRTGIGPAGRASRSRSWRITNADTVSLRLNGKPIGEKPVDKIDFVSWDVPYEPGKLEAVAKKDGKEVARFAVETTGRARGLATGTRPSNPRRRRS